MMLPEFGGFWNWLGWFLIVAVVAQGIGGLIRITFRSKK